MGEAEVDEGEVGGLWHLGEGGDGVLSVLRADNGEGVGEAFGEEVLDDRVVVHYQQGWERRGHSGIVMEFGLGGEIWYT